MNTRLPSATSGLREGIDIPWFKIDDGFHGHPKVVELSLGAVGLWTLAGSWCAKYLTDGAVPEKTVTRLGGDLEQAAELVDSGLWLPSASGFEFKDWCDYQPLKADVEAERAAAQNRMRAVRAKKKGVSSEEVQTNVRMNDEGTSAEVRVTPSQSHPSPIPTTPKGVRAPRGKPEVSLPDQWEPSPAAFQYADEQQIDIGHEVGQFRAHAAANDRRQKDWDGAFRMWLGNAKKFSRPTRQTKDEQIVDVLEQGRRLMAEQLEIDV